MAKENTAEKIVRQAMLLVQQHGYNAVSYHDLARLLGIKTASIHYHFPKKADLGQAIMLAYRQVFKDAIEHIDETVDDPREKWAQYIRLISTIFEGGDKICLGGMLAADFATLPDNVQEQVLHFYAESEAWLGKLLREGHEQGVFRFEGDANTKAKSIFAMIEGTVVTARAFDDTQRFFNAMDWIESTLIEA